MTSSPRISAKEWRWALIWSSAILAISCAPYFFAALTSPAGWRFAGILVNPLDGQSYLAKMQQGVMGEWLFHLTYTPEAHDGALIFTFYLALGHVAALTGLPKPFVFHLARVVAGFGLLFMAFRFTARVTPDPTERRLAFILLLTASGLGWLGVILGAFPIDLWVPEALVPYSLYVNPHFPLAMLLMLIIFDQVIRVSVSAFPVPVRVKPQKARPDHPKPEPEARSPKLDLKAMAVVGLAALAMAMILPFALLTVWAVLAAFLAWLSIRYHRLPMALIWLTLGVVIISTPVILYQYWVSTSNPILAGWGAQNITPAPGVVDFLLGYGLIGLLALLGASLIFRQNGRDLAGGELLVIMWAAVTIVLVYVPFDLQRRLITGLHIPLCILAAIGLCRWLAKSSLKPDRRRLVIVAVVTIGALGTLLVWLLPLIGTRGSPAGSTAALFFVREEEQAAFNWLQQNAGPDQVILTSPRLGLFVPGETGARAYYGHPFETVGAKGKAAQAEAFFRGEIESVSPPADFIIYGPSEQALGWPEGLANHTVVFSTDNLQIYRLTNDRE